MRNKMLKLIIVAIGSFSFSVMAASPSTYFQVKQTVERSSSKDLVKVINDLIKASAPSRMVGQPGHEGAKNFILQSLKAYDPKESGKTSVIDFAPDTEEARRFYQDDLNKKFEGQSKASAEYQKWFGFVRTLMSHIDRLKDQKASNIVWEKQGINTNKMLVITAHYDTINLDTTKMIIPEKDPAPGANYNASGVSVALNLVKALSQIDLNYSVRVVFLDWQALGYLGSFQYAKELKSWAQAPKEIMGVVNLEMLGQDTSFLDRTKKSGNMAIYLRSDAREEAWVRKLVAHGSQVEKKVSFEIKPNNFDQSDTFRFWDQGLIAATFSQNWEDDFNPKFYQNKQDTSETLNHETLYGSYRFIGGAVLSTLLDITR